MTRLILVLLLLGMPHAAFAQVETELTEALLQARLSALEVDNGGEPSPLRASYQEVLQLLQQARDNDSAAEDYSRSLLSAPREEREIRSRLEALAIQPTITIESRLSRLSTEKLQVDAANARAELASEVAARDALDGRLSTQEVKEREIKQRINLISQRLRELPAAQLFVNAEASPSQVEVEKWRQHARRLALSAEQRALEARVTSQPVRYSLLRAERAALLRSINLLEVNIQVMDKLLERASLQRSEQVREQLESLQSDAPILAWLASANVELDEQRRSLSREFAVLSDCGSAVRELTENITERYASARRRVEFARESEALGQILLAQSKESRLALRGQDSCQASIQLGDLVLDRIAREEQLNQIAVAADYVAALAQTFTDAEKLSRSEKEAAIDMTRGRRDLLTGLIALQTNHIDLIGDLAISQRELHELGKAYQDFLFAYLLWVPSHPRLSLASFSAIPAEMGQLLASATGSESLLAPNTSLLVLLLLIFILLALSRPRFAAWRANFAWHVGRPRSDTTWVSVAALATTALESLLWPVLLLALCAAIENSNAPGAPGLIAALYPFAGILFLSTFVKNACRSEGVGITHFRWPTGLCSLVCAEMRWLLRRWFPLAAFTSVLYLLGETTVQAGVTRLAFLAAGLLLAWRLSRLRRPSANNGNTPARVHPVVLPFSLFGLLLVTFTLVIAAGGYLHSAALITTSVVNTLWLAVGLLFLHAMLRRWSLIATRRVRFRALVAGKSQAAAETSPEEERVTAQDLNEATNKLLRLSVILLGLVLAWYVWAPLIPAFGVLEDVVIWTSTSVEEGVQVSRVVSLATIIWIFLLAAMLVFAARNVPAFLELILLQYRVISAGGRYTITTLTSYLIIGGGIIAIFSLLGFSWSELQWLVAALGVGIGFGLQEIVANFISGVIILFERPVRVGDMVTIGETDGIVSKIRIRATTLRDFNGKELVVPNKEFVTGRLLNWSLSDTDTRIIINVGIAYGSDLDAALELLERIVHADERVLKDPAPSCIMSEFGDDALILTARVFIGNIDNLWQVKSELHRIIYREFAAAGLEIAFPQRDVHLDAAEPLRIKLEE